MQGLWATVPSLVFKTFRWQRFVPCVSRSSQMRATFLKSKRCWLIAALAVGLAGALLWFIAKPSGMEIAEVLPSPNGYDDFFAAEKELEGGLPDLNTQSKEELSRILKERASTLKRAREGLTRECRVPIDYSPGATTKIMEHMAEAKTLGLLLRENGHLAEMDADYSKAMRGYLEAVQFATKRFHGGLVIHYLVGAAVGRTAEARLERIIPNLNLEDCRAGVGALLELERVEQPVSEILRRDMVWGRHVTGTGNFQMLVMRLLPQLRKPLVASTAKLQERTRSRRKLLLRLAARAFELETGKAPLSPKDLTPRYLPEALTDPDSGAPLTFSP